MSAVRGKERWRYVQNEREREASQAYLIQEVDTSNSGSFFTVPKQVTRSLEPRGLEGIRRCQGRRASRCKDETRDSCSLHLQGGKLLALGGWRRSYGPRSCSHYCHESGSIATSYRRRSLLLEPSSVSDCRCEGGRPLRESWSQTGAVTPLEV